MTEIRFCIVLIFAVFCCVSGKQLNAATVFADNDFLELSDNTVLSVQAQLSATSGGGSVSTFVSAEAGRFSSVVSSTVTCAQCLVAGSFATAESRGTIRPSQPLVERLLEVGARSVPLLVDIIATARATISNSTFSSEATATALSQVSYGKTDLVSTRVSISGNDFQLEEQRSTVPILFDILPLACATCEISRSDLIQYTKFTTVFTAIGVNGTVQASAFGDPLVRVDPSWEFANLVNANDFIFGDGSVLSPLALLGGNSPPPVAAVPLPAGGWLILSGLFLLAGLNRRGRRLSKLVSHSDSQKRDTVRLSFDTIQVTQSFQRPPLTLPAADCPAQRP